jgi:hypothetical protein
MKILFRAYFHQKNFQNKVGRKFIRVRIRIRTFSKVGSGCGQKSSGSATLVVGKYSWSQKQPYATCENCLWYGFIRSTVLREPIKR